MKSTGRSIASPTRYSVFATIAFVLLASPASAADIDVSQRIAQCVTCHGANGNSATAKIPSLAGQPEFFLLNQLILMREGVRQVAVMTPFVSNLSDAEAEGLAKHFAALEAKPSGEAVNPALAARGAALVERLHCASCHLPTYVGRNQMPRLAKQRIDYMVESLKAIRESQRAGGDSLMTAAVAGISDEDLEALAHYVASH